MCNTFYACHELVIWLLYFHSFYYIAAPVQSYMFPLLLFSIPPLYMFCCVFRLFGLSLYFVWFYVIVCFLCFFLVILFVFVAFVLIAVFCLFVFLVFFIVLCIVLCFVDLFFFFYYSSSTHSPSSSLPVPLMICVVGV